MSTTATTAQPTSSGSAPAQPVRRWWTPVTAGLLEVLVRAEHPTPLLPGGSPRWATRLVWLAVGVYALVVGIVASVWFVTHHGPPPFWPLIFALTVAPLLVSVRRPLDGWRLATLVLPILRLVLCLLPDQPVALLAPWQWCAYLPVVLSVAVRHRARTVLITTGFTALMLLVVTLLSARPTQTLDLLPLTLVALVVVVLLGYSVGARGRIQQALQIQQRRSEAAQAEQARLAERARIAREMHDVVAHHMSMIAVRGETAPYRITDLPEAGRQEFGEIGAAARAAMTDMQRLLGVLRGTDQPADRTPQPGLARLPDLVATTRQAGVDVRLAETSLAELPELADGVPEAVGLSAYRIVQEALTNARRHAPGAAVLVELRRRPDALEVAVRNGPGDGTASVAAGPGGGHGLVGMRERAALHDGSVRAEPADDGGFEVLATLSLPAGASQGER